MKNDKLKNIIILLLIVIIIILSVLVGLFATNKISLNSSSNNDDGSISENENNEVKEENTDIVGLYQNRIQVTEDSYSTIEFELKSDNTVNYVIDGTISENYNSNAAMSYSGTYLEKDNTVILSIISTDDNCKDTEAKYACVDIITLLKQNDGTLSYEDYSPKRIFKKIN